ncbi:hypothetical protein BDK51DRAFT_49948 [Blyttiomyces helicus]|uniref:Uncharacterized protein n=1 Tax=Blyttiomyces helicus TaxID=388810 RepID=A0A4P9VX54_9FUNG|nr:hypothetical protein BDK51DRAFT_49948 [Blyttiomyces helicus]|eukprot:RKO83465.1 hypothetical protein BDK51DRAFT_49948 [Blyttiomyces helicus]
MCGPANPGGKERFAAALEDLLEKSVLPVWEQKRAVGAYADQDATLFLRTLAPELLLLEDLEKLELQSFVDSNFNRNHPLELPADIALNTPTRTAKMEEGSTNKTSSATASLTRSKSRSGYSTKSARRPSRTGSVTSSELDASAADALTRSKSATGSRRPSLMGSLPTPTQGASARDGRLSGEQDGVIDEFHTAEERDGVFDVVDAAAKRDGVFDQVGAAAERDGVFEEVDERDTESLTKIDAVAEMRGIVAESPIGGGAGQTVE